MPVFVGKRPSPSDVLCQWCEGKLGKEYYCVQIHKRKNVSWQLLELGDTITYAGVCGKCVKKPVGK